MGQRPKHLKKRKEFPSLTKKNHSVESDIDPNYNCIAYAAGITTRKYWPIFHPDYAWIRGIPSTEEVESFVKFYETFGYAETDNGEYVEGHEKIAIFIGANGKP